MKKNASIKRQIFIPIILIFIITNIVVYFFVSYQTKQNIIDSSILSATHTVQQFKTLRKYYASNVVGKVKKNTKDLKINFDHENSANTIPLPATMIHDMSALISQEKGGVKLKLYSDFPFPNRKDRVLDSFSTQAMETFRQGRVDNPFVVAQKYENIESVRVAIPDYMVAQGCVNCHNSRADSPKTDWNIGDVRGALEVIVPIENQLTSVGVLNFQIVGAILILGLIVLSVLYFFFDKVVIRPLNALKQGLENFFDYLHQRKESIEAIKVLRHDEIGLMSEAINENIANTTHKVKMDVKFIDEVKDIVENVKAGYLNDSLNQPIESKNLEELRLRFNEMIAGLNSNIAKDTNKLLQVLENFTNQDFTQSIENDKGQIATSINKLGENITHMLSSNKQDGLTLDDSAHKLLDNVQNLNNITGNTAAQLEETAASLEQMTNNIRNNSSDISQMSNYANELSNSASSGKNMANKTTHAMEEINTQVNAINEAISVIDQIAFQTNILSLNAAVEAATAGEAGRGFAVVAGEVRTLASRSAEAAKQIKTLVERATLKANEGKDISDNMIEGYNQLNDNINKTLELITKVSEASSQQQVEIEQINASISTLDAQTQKNANVASNTQEIAMHTSKIAKDIVQAAEDKNFIGKENIKAKKMK